MARVFAARDDKHGRRVAVKVLRPEGAAWMGADRFHREIDIAARLQHPHILPIYDSGAADDILYYVMPLVTGETLRQRLERDRTLPVDEAVRIAGEVADALGYAHAENVVHRDIKPANILLSQGHALVADFGVARLILEAEDTKLTHPGGSVGTPAYMSPEQCFGERTIDGRADQYSLACMLYEMLAGELPFTGNTSIAILTRKSTEPAHGLTALRGEVSRSIESAVLRALHRDPDRRFATMAEFGAALRATDADQTRPVLAAPGACGWSIAVLPFANMSPDPENEYLSDGITDELIHVLAGLGGLRVLARTSTFAFKGRCHDVRAIGRELQVSAVLEGSVRRSGDRLRVTTQLVDVVSGFELWSERYDRTVQHVFDVQDEISRAIVDALKVGVLRTEARLVEAPTDNVPAYESYLKGRFHWNQRTETGLLRSLEYLGAAAEADPHFLQAHAGLADAHLTLGLYGVMPPERAMPQALAAAERVLAVEPRSAEALATRGSVRALYRHDWTGAERDLSTAIEAGPQYPTAHQWYATHCLVPLRRFAEARARLRRARDLDPLSAAVAVSVAVVDYYEGRYGDAAALCRSVLERDPGFGLAAYFQGQAMTAMGRHAEALDLLERAKVLTGGSPEVESALGVGQASAGDTAAAQGTLARIQERHGRATSRRCSWRRSMWPWARRISRCDASRRRIAGVPRTSSCSTSNRRSSRSGRSRRSPGWYSGFAWVRRQADGVPLNSLLTIHQRCLISTSCRLVT
jgi:TolB-like protein/tetratricopeptide (TPR) repeat protein